MNAVVDDNRLPQLDMPVVHSILPSATAATESEVHNEESCREADVSNKSVGGENVCIRHNQVPLKAHCQRCSFTCNNDNQLAVHMKTGHESLPCKPGNFKCPECSMNTVRKEVFVWHLSHHTGSHSFMYYACSGCDVEKQCVDEVSKHIMKRHSDERLRCTPVALVENVKYLQNIMKCPICEEGLLWKRIFIEHLHHVHYLSDLASYLNTNYSDDCPDVLSFPGHLLKSVAEHRTESVTKVAESFDTLTVSRFHCDNCEFSTNNSSAYRQHRNKHNQARTESSSEDNTSSVEAALSSNVLLDKTKPHRTAKMKAYSRIISPPLPRDENQRPIRVISLPLRQKPSPKRKFKARRKSVALKRTASRSEERSYAADTTLSEGRNWPYSSRTKNATPVASTQAASKRALTDDNFFAEFVSSLPSSYVFSEDVKCPRCYYSSRVRVNLLRHVKSHMAADSKSDASAAGSSESNVCLSYGLWQPDSFQPCETPTDEEPMGTGMSEENDKDENDESIVSMNSTGNASEECPASAEIDSFTRSESRDSFSESGIRENSADDDDDGTTAEPERLDCEICSKQFKSDVDLERHISRSHGGPYVCHLCGVLLWQQNDVRGHYSAMHPSSQLHFEMLKRKTVDSSKEVGVSGCNEKKIARVQGKYRALCRYIMVFVLRAILHVMCNHVLATLL